MEEGGFIGPYRLEKPAGEGGMGSVWSARHPTLDRRVAIKLIRSEVQASPQAREAFLREVRVLSRLHGPQIVQVMDFGFTDTGDPYMVTEFLDGEDLLGRLRRTGPVPALEVIGIGVEVLKALAEAHAEGLVHRDLKPGNVFLQRIAGGTRTAVKVLDFGVAKLLEGNDEDTLWPEAQLKGSPRYMSPEQVRSGAITPATDIYAFGALLYRVLTGEPVFTGARGDVLRAHVERPPQSMRVRNPGLDIPEELDDIVLGCLEKDPSQRPGSAGALQSRMERLGGRLRAAAEAKASLPAPPPAPSPPVGPLKLDWSGGDLVGGDLSATPPPPPPRPSPPVVVPTPTPSAQDVGGWFGSTDDPEPAPEPRPPETPTPAAPEGGWFEADGAPPATPPPDPPAASVGSWFSAGEPAEASADVAEPGGWGVESDEPLELDLDAGQRTASVGSMQGVSIPTGGLELEDDGEADEGLELAFDPDTRRDDEPEPPSEPPAAEAEPEPVAEGPPVDEAPEPESLELGAGRAVADRPDGYRPAVTAARPAPAAPWYEQHRMGLLAIAGVIGLLMVVWLARTLLVGDPIEDEPAMVDAGAPVVDAGPRRLDIGPTPLARDRGVGMTETPSVVRGPAARMGAPDPADTPTVLVNPDPGPATFIRISDGEVICESAPHCRVPIDMDVRVVKKGYRSMRLKGDDLYDRRGSAWRIILRR